jgi:hypothetical protein
MNLGGDGPFQQWNPMDKWDWLIIIGGTFLIFGACGFLRWLVG